MNREQVQELVDERVQDIVVDSKSLGESKQRAARFLSSVALLTSRLRDIEVARSKMQTIMDATYAQVIQGKTGGVTEKKLATSSDPEFTAIRERFDEVDAEYNWVKGYIKIFDNAHLMFRQYSREG